MQNVLRSKGFIKNGILFFLLMLFQALIFGCGIHNTKHENEKKLSIIKPEEYIKRPALKDKSRKYSVSDDATRRSESIAGYANKTPLDFGQNFNTEEYNYINENEFKTVSQNPLSTFSIDVDTASYSNIRRFIKHNQMPAKDSIRIEEMINYFTYNYPQPKNGRPFSIVTEISGCPWNKKNKLALIALQGKSIDYADLKPSNLVFLIDSSGSMSSSNKLPLLKKSLKMLLSELSSQDRISIIAYAGSAGLILPSTSAVKKDVIISAFERINAGGATAGGAGINLAYKTAKENLITDGNNRVILCTDGDFNIGTSSTGDLIRLIEEKRKDNIYLTICGFGMGNYKDGRMEKISNAGNGNYFYIDSIKESNKVFVKEMRANMFTIAKDVKIQIEFNPKKVKGYRLLGYENRLLANEDFNNDKKDAGELGAGHTVTALYEIVFTGSKQKINEIDILKYQQTTIKDNASTNDELMTVKLRYKQPEESKSNLIVKTVVDAKTELNESSENFRFSAAVAGFGMLLRNSKFKNNLTLKAVARLAKGAKGEDRDGYRGELVDLIETSMLLIK